MAAATAEAPEWAHVLIAWLHADYTNALCEALSVAPTAPHRPPQAKELVKLMADPGLGNAERLTAISKALFLFRRAFCELPEDDGSQGELKHDTAYVYGRASATILETVFREMNRLRAELERAVWAPPPAGKAKPKPKGKRPAKIQRTEEDSDVGAAAVEEEEVRYR